MNETNLQLILDRKRVNKPSSADDLKNLIEQLDDADNFVKANLNNKLQPILEQMRFLKQQAVKIIEDQKRDMDIHRADCNMIKKPGQIYHRYYKNDKESFMSIISPEEWGSSMPYRYDNSYYLDADKSWVPLHELEAKKLDRELIQQIASCDTEQLKLTF